MAAIHPSPETLAALRRRWEGQEARLRAIAAAILEGRDWTVHLAGLAYADEVPPLDGEAMGRDLRGAPLDRFLLPPTVLREAEERDAGVVAAITLEGLRSNTPIPDATPFPVAPEGAQDVVRAIRMGERFFLASAADRPVGVVRWSERREFMDLTGDRPYAEVSGLAVLPSWRRRGIGEALLRLAEKTALCCGFRAGLLRTTLELGLVPWYERLGYVVRLTRQMTYPDAPTFLDVVMTRSLAVVTPPPPGSRRSRPAAQDLGRPCVTT